ncbi:MAG: hypothetical protein NVS3B26_16750 [Mycobacteriales bacterium]
MASLTAAGVHVFVGPVHVQQSLLAGLFFFAVAAAQIGWAIAVLRTPRDTRLLTGAVGSALLIALWAVSRLVGVPVSLGGEGVEPVGALDLLATAAEALVLVVCTRQLWLRAGPDVGVR